MTTALRLFSRVLQRPATRPLVLTHVSRISYVEVPIPEYTPRNGEEEGIKRRRLLYQSRWARVKVDICNVYFHLRKRGMLENGLLLRWYKPAAIVTLSIMYFCLYSTFAARYLDTLTPQQLCEYDSLINKPSNDWDIYYWATGKEPVPQEYTSSVMTLLQQHATNDQREARITQPDLYSTEK